MRLEILSPLLLLASAPAAAQPPARAPAPDVGGPAAATAVSEVVVVANRTPQPLETVGQSVSVLTLPELRADQETVVSDIIARLPGVTVNRNGGLGQATSVRIRGAETDQTVVLLDGVKLNDPSAVGGGYNFADLVTSDISRIEVLRGPQSTLYGGAAIGGVVNIVTADATKAFQGDAQAEGGEYGTAYGKAGLGGRSDRLTWRLAGSYLTTDGVSSFNERRGGRERDGYRNAAASGRLTYRLLTNLTLDLRGFYANSRNDFDGFAPPTYALGDTPDIGRTEQFVGYAALNLDLLGGRFRNRFAVQGTQIDRENRNPTQAPNPVTFDSTGRNSRAEYQGTFALTPAWTAVFGAERERASFRSASPSSFAPAPTPGKADVTITSGYLQVNGEALPGLNLTGGVRYDDHETFGGHATGQVSAAWRPLGPDTTLRASYGEGFKAPSLYQLYSDYGNTSLRPESAEGFDLGVEQRFLGGRITASATWYHRDTDDLITFASCFPAVSPRCATQPFGFYDNIAKASAEGWELGAAWKATDALDLTANYTSTDSRDETPGGANRDRELARRPRDTANFGASYVWPFRLSTALAVRYAGRSFDDAANRTRLKSYILWDVRAAYPIRSGLEVYGRLENLTDVAYETTAGYGSLGRAGYVGVRATF